MPRDTAVYTPSYMQEQPLNPRFPVVRRSRGDMAAAKRLTCAIMRCGSVGSLEALLTSHAHQLNHIHLAAALSALPRLAPPRRSAHAGNQRAMRASMHVLVRRLTSALARQLPQLGPRELSNCLGAVAKLGVHPGAHWMEAVVGALHDTLPRASGQDLGATAWALARMGHHPSPSWSRAFVGAASMQLGSMDAQALCNLMWAFARWDYVPPRALLLSAVDVAAGHLQVWPPYLCRTVICACEHTGELAFPFDHAVCACLHALSSPHLPGRWRAAVDLCSSVSPFLRSHVPNE